MDEPLSVEQDCETCTLTVEGQRYSFELMRAMAGQNIPEGAGFVAKKINGRVVMCQYYPEHPWSDEQLLQIGRDVIELYRRQKV